METVKLSQSEHYSPGADGLLHITAWFVLYAKDFLLPGFGSSDAVSCFKNWAEVSV